MTRPDGAVAWSARANYWRGDRALGGRLHVVHGRLAFVPHGVERALGGDTSFESRLADIVTLAKAPRSFSVPRRRLIVTTSDGRTAYFLLNRLDDAIATISRASAAAGGNAAFVPAGTVPTTPPETVPDDSGAMNLIFSGWTQVFATVFWTLCLLGVAAGSRNPWGVAGLGVLVVFSAWRAVAGFRRTARLENGRR